MSATVTTFVIPGRVLPNGGVAPFLLADECDGLTRYDTDIPVTRQAKGIEGLSHVARGDETIIRIS